MASYLTNGGIHKFLNELDAESTVFQVLKIKCIKSGNHDRYRMKISDGTNFSASCMVGSLLNLKVENLTPFSIIRVNRYLCNNIGNRKVGIILDLDILHIGREGDGIIGNPTLYETSPQQGASSSAISSNSQQTPIKISTSQLDQPSTSTFNRGASNYTTSTRNSQQSPIKISSSQLDQPNSSALNTGASKNSQQPSIINYLNRPDQPSTSSFNRGNPQQSPMKISSSQFDQRSISTFNLGDSNYTFSSKPLQSPMKISSSQLDQPSISTFNPGDSNYTFSSNSQQSPMKISSSQSDQQSSSTFNLGTSGNPQQSPMKISLSQSDQTNTSAFSKNSLNTCQNSLLAGEPFNVPEGIYPISSLTYTDPPSNFRGTIRARVVNKSDIIPYKNDFEEGRRFYMDIIDESGEIRVVLFNNLIDMFYDIIKVDNVYYITQAHLEKANELYMPLKNESVMIFDIKTRVALCQEETSVPRMMQFQFVSIDQLENVECHTFIDVIGICTGVDDVSTVKKRATGKECIKREIQISDDSGQVRVTLWRPHAEDFNGSLDSVIAIKGACVSDFDRSLYVPSHSILKINPDIQESHNLRESHVGYNTQTWNLSQ